MILIVFGRIRTAIVIMGDEDEFPVIIEHLMDASKLMEIRSMFHKHRKSGLKTTTPKENMLWLKDTFRKGEVVILVAYSKGEDEDEDEDEEFIEKQYLGFSALFYSESTCGKSLVMTDHYAMPFISKKKKDEIYLETLKKLNEIKGELGVSEVVCQIDAAYASSCEEAGFASKPNFAFTLDVEA